MNYKRLITLNERIDVLLQEQSDLWLEEMDLKKKIQKNKLYLQTTIDEVLSMSREEENSKQAVNIFI